MLSAFDNLAQLQSRCHNNAIGLPSKIEVINDWVGIGFSANSVRCIARMTEVAEILPVPETIRIPGVKKWVKGLANIRGALMPIVDLKGFLQGGATPPSKKNRVLVVNLSGVLAGLLVEEVFGLRKFKEGMLAENQSDEVKAMRMTYYVTGEFSDNNEHWNIFSIKTLLTTEQFLRVV